MNHILASVDTITTSQALQYAVGIVGTLFGIIIALLGLVYNQIQKVIDLLRKQVEKQDETHQVQIRNVEARADSCRSRSESAHRIFHVGIEELKERVVRIETMLDERTQS